MEHIIKNITTYLNSKNTNGAFQVRGEWGSGKTFFFKNILPKNIQAHVKRSQVMVSLFGMKNVKEIPFRLLNAYINKKSESGEDVSEDMNRGLDYLDMKYGDNKALRNVNLHDDEELIYNIIPKEDVYLCLDDVERFIKRDNVEELMGVVNNLVENIGYKVILIFNDHYYTKDNEVETVKSKFKEKVISGAVTFVPNVSAVYADLIGEYDHKAFSSFMRRKDVLALFLPNRRHREYRKGFENIRNIKFVMSNFFGIFTNYQSSLDDEKTVSKLKYYLAFIIGVSIEYKKDILSDGDDHGIEYDEDVFSVDLGDDDELSVNSIQELFDEYEETADEKERREKKENFDAIYRRRFYSVYIKDVGQKIVFHEELYNYITKGNSVDFERLDANIEKKVFSLEKAENPGNVIVEQILDGTIFNYSDEEIKNKLLTLLKSVEDCSLVACAAYVNAFSFLDMYKAVVGKSHNELLEIFKKSITHYIANNEINQMESTGLEMVAQNVPGGTSDFYNFMRSELHNKWKDGQKQEMEEMINLFNTDIPRFCELFAERQGRVTIHYIDDAVLHNIPEDMVKQRMQNLSPRDVHELAKFLSQRYIPQDIYAYHFQKEKGFLEAMRRGIEAIDGDDTVSKIEAKKVLMLQVEKALRHMKIAR